MTTEREEKYQMNFSSFYAASKRPFISSVCCFPLCTDEVHLFSVAPRVVNKDSARRVYLTNECLPYGIQYLLFGEKSFVLYMTCAMLKTI